MQNSLAIFFTLQRCHLEKESNVVTVIVFKIKKCDFLAITSKEETEAIKNETRTIPLTTIPVFNSMTPNEMY